MALQTVDDFVRADRKTHYGPWPLTFRFNNRHPDFPSRKFDKQSLQGVDERRPYQFEIPDINLLLKRSEVVIVEPAVVCFCDAFLCDFCQRSPQQPI